MYVGSTNNLNNKIYCDISLQNNDSSNYFIISDTDVSKILSCPTDKNIKKILEFIQKNNFEQSYEFVNKIIIDNGISLVELINCIYEYFMDNIINNNNSIIKYNLEKSVEIIKNMSIINENLTYCNNDNTQIISFLAIFFL